MNRAKRWNKKFLRFWQSNCKMKSVTFFSPSTSKVGELPFSRTIGKFYFFYCLSKLDNCKNTLFRMFDQWTILKILHKSKKTLINVRFAIVRGNQMLLESFSSSMALSNIRKSITMEWIKPSQWCQFKFSKLILWIQTIDLYLGFLYWSTVFHQQWFFSIVVLNH